MLEFKKKSACIIGLGKIGFSYNSSSKFKIKSHYKALKKSKYFNLVAGIDHKRNKKFNKFNLPIFKNIKILSKNFNPYLLIISVPTKYHLEVFNDAIKYLKPKIILFEKPLTNNYVDAKRIVNLCKKKKIYLFVNYIRNYLPNLSQLKKLVSNKKVLVTLNYSGNFLNDFCHYFYLFDYLFGSKLYLKTKKTQNLFNNCKLQIKKNKKSKKDSIKIKGKDFWVDWKNNNIVKIKKKSHKIKINLDIDNYQYHVFNNIAQNIFFKKKNCTIEGKEALKFHRIFNDKKIKIN